MLRVVVYSIGTLLLMVGCAQKKQGITCTDPDPATGQCLRDATQVVDPLDTEAILQLAQQSQKKRMEVERQLQEDIAQAKQTGDTQTAAALQQSLTRIITETTEAGLTLTAPPEIDDNKVPAVKLKLQNKNNMGVRVGLSFTHVKNISDFVFYYGGKGRSQVFNFDDFTDDKVQLSDVEIPVLLSFKFKGSNYCAQIDLNYSFEETHWPVSKHMHVSEGMCEL